MAKSQYLPIALIQRILSDRVQSIIFEMGITAVNIRIEVAQLTEKFLAARLWHWDWKVQTITSIIITTEMFLSLLLTEAFILYITGFSDVKLQCHPLSSRHIQLVQDTSQNWLMVNGATLKIINTNSSNDSTHKEGDHSGMCQQSFTQLHRLKLFSQQPPHYQAEFPSNKQWILHSSPTRFQLICLQHSGEMISWHRVYDRTSNIFPKPPGIPGN